MVNAPLYHNSVLKIFFDFFKKICYNIYIRFGKENWKRTAVQVPSLRRLGKEVAKSQILGQKRKIDFLKNLCYNIYVINIYGSIAQW